MAMSKILVPLDGSSLAEKALLVATALARQSDATICLVTVPGGKEGDERRSDAETYLASVATSLLESDRPTCVHVGSGSVVQGIVQIARDERVDLIVMTTHGRSGIARRILGSITETLILDAPTPVYVIRSDTAHQTVLNSGLASGIIVPLDGSELAESALDDAIQLASTCQSPVYLLRVIDEHANLIEQEEAKAYLEEVAGRLAEQGVNAVPELATGNPSQAIARAMEERPGSVVVLATRGLSGFVRGRRGSVADWLVRQGPGAVVVISPKERALLGLAIH